MSLGIALYLLGVSPVTEKSGWIVIGGEPGRALAESQRSTSVVTTGVSAATPGNAAGAQGWQKGGRMISNLLEYLDKHDIRYSISTHSPAYTAQGIAAVSHTPGKQMVKSVVVNIDGELMLAVLPATFQVDLRLLKKATKANAVRIASEEEFKDSFPECELGAMPPFGNLFGMKVIADESLTRDKEIAFNACSHRELIRMAWEDFRMLANPWMARFTVTRIVEAA
jgi:Ala-tRNA(Pro) deacylase